MHEAVRQVVTLVALLAVLSFAFLLICRIAEIAYKLWRKLRR